MIKNFFFHHIISILTILFSLGFGLAPILSVSLASAIANYGNCSINEGSVTPCRIAGFEIGGILSTMWVAGWLMLVSIPVGIIGLVVGISIFIIEIFIFKF